MRRITYAGISLYTSDRVADALLEYAAELARAGDAGIIEIPGRSSDGELGMLKVLVGPASQLVSEDAVDTGFTVEDEAAVDELETRTDELRTSESDPPFTYLG